jgi:hypothetical protein
VLVPLGQQPARALVRLRLPEDVPEAGDGLTEAGQRGVDRRWSCDRLERLAAHL